MLAGASAIDGDGASTPASYLSSATSHLVGVSPACNAYSGFMSMCSCSESFTCSSSFGNESNVPTHPYSGE